MDRAYSQGRTWPRRPDCRLCWLPPLLPCTLTSWLCTWHTEGRLGTQNLWGPRRDRAEHGTSPCLRWASPGHGHLPRPCAAAGPCVERLGGPRRCQGCSPPLWSWSLPPGPAAAATGSRGHPFRSWAGPVPARGCPAAAWFCLLPWHLPVSCGIASSGSPPFQGRLKATCPQGDGDR